MAIGIPAGREIRRQFWLLVRAGVLHRQAAAALGLNRDTGREWFRQAGGVVPAFLTVPHSDHSCPLPSARKSSPAWSAATRSG
jgi:hypothetical protein